MARKKKVPSAEETVKTTTKRREFAYEDMRAPKEVEPVQVRGHEREGRQGQREVVQPYTRMQEKRPDGEESHGVLGGLFRRKRKTEQEKAVDAAQDMVDYLQEKP